MAEAHQAAIAGFVFDLVEELGAVVTFAVDFFQHFQHRLVGTAVQRTPKGADAGRSGGENIGLTRGHHPHRRGGTVLFVVGVEQEDEVERADDFRVDFVVLAGEGEHHVEKVLRVFQLRLRVTDREAVGLAEGAGRDGADLGNKSGGVEGERLLEGFARSLRAGVGR